MRTTVLPVLFSLALACVSGCGADGSLGDVVVRLASGDCRAGATCSADVTGVLAADVVNLGTEPAAVHVALDGDPAFHLDQAPAGTLAGGASAPLVVRTSDVDAAAAEATLFVLWVPGARPFRTTAAPGDPRPLFDAVTLHAHGDVAPAGRCPVISSCVFPATAVGGSSSCDVVLENDSDVSETVDELSVVGDDGVFDSGVFVLPTILAPGTSLPLRFSAAPTSPGSHAAEVSLRCGDASAVGALEVVGT